jgi:hypothetical protein
MPWHPHVNIAGHASWDMASEKTMRFIVAITARSKTAFPACAIARSFHLFRLVPDPRRGRGGRPAARSRRLGARKDIMSQRRGRSRHALFSRVAKSGFQLCRPSRARYIVRVADRHSRLHTRRGRLVRFRQHDIPRNRVDEQGEEILPITLLSNPTLKAACLGDILPPQIRTAEV